MATPATRVPRKFLAPGEFKIPRKRKALARLGDTLEFAYKAPNIHDENPQIFFLAKVGKLIHGLNQHYLTPQEKAYFFFVLKMLYYTKIETGQLNAYDFYYKYIKNRMFSNAYRTYRTDRMSAVKIQDFVEIANLRKVDIRLDRPRRWPKFQRGDKVRYVSMVRNKLSWINGTVEGQKVPGGIAYKVRNAKGEIVIRHPADLKKR